MKKVLKYLLIGFIAFVIINPICLYLRWSIESKKAHDKLNNTTPVMIDEKELVKIALDYTIDYLNREETKQSIIKELDIWRQCRYLNFNKKNVLSAKIDDISDIKKMEYTTYHEDEYESEYLTEKRIREEHYSVCIELTLKPECILGNGYSFRATEIYRDGLLNCGNVIKKAGIDEIKTWKTVYISKDGNVVDFSDLITVELSEYGKEQLAEAQRKEAISKDVISTVINH